MKNLSSRQAKAKAITPKVKKAVMERDMDDDGYVRCIICSSPYGLPEAHFIGRAQGGLGVEENIISLCRNCHYLFDNGSREQRTRLKNMAREYLKSKYTDWDEGKLIYKKYGGIL